MNDIYAFRYDLFRPGRKFHLIEGKRSGTYSLCDRLKFEPFANNLQLYNYSSELMPQRYICTHCLRKLEGLNNE